MPPSSPLQMLKRSFQSKLVVTAFSRPAAPARYTASPNETDVRQQHDHRDQRDHQPQEDDAHLLHVRPGDRLDAAEHRVGDHHARPSASVVSRSGQPRITESTMRRRIDREPRRKPALAAGR